MKIKEKLEPYFVNAFNINLDKEYKIEKVKPMNLLVSNRIDLIAKIKYIESIDKKYNTNYFEKLYISTIEAFSQGSYVEPSNIKKNSKGIFLNTFKKLIKDIKNNGIDQNITVVPVDKNGVIIDGAHRTAISIYYGKNVPIVNIPKDGNSYGLDFFKKRLLSPEFLDYLCLEYSKIKNNIYAICLWPRCSKEQKEMATKYIHENLNVIYEKKVSLTKNGLKNFMIQIYGHQKWVGTVKNKHSGVHSKLEQCYGENGNISLFVVEEDNIKNILKVKNNIRNMLKLGNHSIHSTDNKEETVDMLSILMNNNSIYFLNVANVDEFPKFYNHLDSLNEILIKNKVSYEDIVIDSSAVLTAYGLRENNDIDILISPSVDSSKIKNIENHNSFGSLYGKEIDELIYNPTNYFYFKGFKFLTLDLVKIMKQKRNEKKDKMDIKLIDSINNSRGFIYVLLREKHKIKRVLRNIYSPVYKLTIIVLKKLRLFNLAKKIKDIIKRNNYV